jgi:hypothetical protein
MKKINLFLIVVILFACEDYRDLPVIPSISFNKIEFHERSTTSAFESLIVYFDFKDGDGDLGLTGDQTDAPYHSVNYFYDAEGKVLTIRSRSNPAYSFLPPYEEPYNCTNYTDPNQTIYFPAAVLDNTFTIVGTKEINGVIHHGVNDIIYFERNPDHFNITVDFLVKNSDGSFSVFDWRSEFCNQSFDGRFPPLSDGSNAVEGTLRYEMKSLGFKNLFGNKVIKLSIKIKDRALHESNIIETPEFTL